MMLVTHATFGAFLATKISDPLISSPLLVASHFAFDRIPHWDLGRGFKKRAKLFNLILGGIDFSTAIFLCWLIFQNNKPLNPLLWTGVFFSLLPDFLEFPVLFLDWKFFPFNKLEIIHSHYFHRRTKFPQGLIPQLIIIVFASLLA